MVKGLRFRIFNPLRRGLNRTKVLHFGWESTEPTTSPPKWTELKIWLELFSPWRGGEFDPPQARNGKSVLRFGSFRRAGGSAVSAFQFTNSVIPGFFRPQLTDLYR